MVHPDQSASDTIGNQCCSDWQEIAVHDYKKGKREAQKVWTWSNRTREENMHLNAEDGRNEMRNRGFLIFKFVIP